MKLLNVAAFVVLIIGSLFVLVVFLGCGSIGDGGDDNGGGAPSPSYWAKSYGGSGHDHANSIQQTSDRGYIVAGHTNSFGAGSSDFWVLKLNNNGTVAWEKTYGGSLDDSAYSIQQTSDEGYIVAGITNSFGVGSSDFWVLKLSNEGTVAWEKTYGGSLGDSAYSIQQTSDEGYIVAGETWSFGKGVEFWVLKLNRDGTVGWQKAYGGIRYESAYSIQQTSDSGYIIAGVSDSFNSDKHFDREFWVLKLKNDGAIEWQKVYSESSIDIGDQYSPPYIQQTIDGGYIMAGAIKGGSTLSVLKLKRDGTIEWQKTYTGGSASFIQQTTDGGYIVAGRRGNFRAYSADSWVLKLRGDGTVEWQKSYEIEKNDYSFSIQQTSEGGYIMAGESGIFSGKEDLWVLRLNSNGTINFNTQSGASTMDTDAEVDDSILSDSKTSATVTLTSITPFSSSATVIDTNAIITQLSP